MGRGGWGLIPFRGIRRPNLQGSWAIYIVTLLAQLLLSRLVGALLVQLG